MKLKNFTHASLFSGIGAAELASERMSWKNVFHCEINPFALKILKHYWPTSKTHEDIKTTDFTIYQGKIDVLTGGFPCQPYSSNGKRKGNEDERHLWPEMLRAIREIKPSWIVGENVLGIVNWNDGLVFQQVQHEMEIEGYEVQTYILPACGIDAPHQRSRVWFIAYSNSNDALRRRHAETGYTEGKSETIKEERKRIRTVVKRTSKKEVVANSTGKRLQNSRQKGFWKLQKKGRKRLHNRFKLYGSDAWRSFPSQPPFCSGNDGVPSGISGITLSKHRSESIKAFGNTIVPQLIHKIFKAIESYENRKTTY